ncbi:MAG: hypothetical protein PHN56_04745 [Candidatus Nanoarchaeia archaeon]|nr:hypothetical protein [Candidatus Nanoarchaeia archaeon]
MPESLERVIDLSNINDLNKKLTLDKYIKDKYLDINIYKKNNIKHYLKYKLAKNKIIMLKYSNTSENEEVAYNFIEKYLTQILSLKELDLSNSILKLIPNSIGNLTALKELYLNDMELKEIPNTIGNLTKLKELYLASNNLEEIPETFNNFKEIFLGLKNNNLKFLPKNIQENLIIMDSLHNPSCFNQKYKSAQEYFEFKTIEKTIENLFTLIRKNEKMNDEELNIILKNPALSNSILSYEIKEKIKAAENYQNFIKLNPKIKKYFEEETIRINEEKGILSIIL